MSYKHRIFSEASRKKLSASRTGFKMSEEQKLKISRLLTGTKLPEFHKQKIREGVQKFRNGIKHANVNKEQEQIAGRPRPHTCEICHNSGSICFDHNHETGQFRGWICTNCNIALGYIKDNVQTLQAMIVYLQHEN